MQRCGFSCLKTTAPSKWLIDTSHRWIRVRKGIDVNALKDYGISEHEKISDFMAAHRLTYISDCGTSIYIRHI